MLDLDPDIEFLDFGSSHGHSAKIARKLFRSRRGMGIDIDPDRVQAARSSGLACMESDLTRIELPADCVRFVFISHVLEHLHNLDEVKTVLRAAVRSARDFIYIQGPYFDADNFLATRGLKFYWSDWKGHRCHLTVAQIATLLLEIGQTEFAVFLSGRVTNSRDRSIHPLDSIRDQHEYHPALHPPKSIVAFPHNLFREIIFCVKLREFEGWPNTLKRIGRLKRAQQWEPHRMSGWFFSKQTPREETAVAPIAPRSALEIQTGNPKYLAELRKRLILHKRWCYLRYLHLRQGFIHAQDVKSVLAVGCGRGYAELALAIEFPEVHFHLTDIESDRPPQYLAAQNLVKTWRVENVTFGALDITRPGNQRYDLVCSVEVLEHIQDDDRAAAEMRATANKYVFALIPFADANANADERLRARVLERNEHFLVGYNEEMLRELFPNLVKVAGCYWPDRGRLLREKIEKMEEPELLDKLDSLLVEAEMDLLDKVPRVFPEAQGIWALARV